jgi:DNA mismatch repair ATPase MutS
MRFTFVPCSVGGSMHLSQSAISALSLLPRPSTAGAGGKSNGSSNKRRGIGSVFDLLDECCTSMGSRRLMQWLRAPSTDEHEINQRLGVVQELFAHAVVRDRLRTEALKGCPDAKRLTKVVKNVVSAQQHGDGPGKGGFVVWCCVVLN